MVPCPPPGCRRLCGATLPFSPYSGRQRRRTDGAGAAEEGGLKQQTGRDWELMSPGAALSS